MENSTRNFNRDQYETGSDSEVCNQDETDNNASLKANLLLHRLSSKKRSGLYISQNHNQSVDSQQNNISSQMAESFEVDDPREIEISSPNEILSQESFNPSSYSTMNGQGLYSSRNPITREEMDIMDEKRSFKSLIPSIFMALFFLFFLFLIYCYITIKAPSISSYESMVNFLSWIPTTLSGFFSSNWPRISSSISGTHFKESHANSKYDA